jgi:hypothetical protein
MPLIINLLRAFYFSGGDHGGDFLSFIF